MARLNSFKIDSRKRDAGEWIRPDPDNFDDLEILTRGQTDVYTDAMAAAMRKAAVPFGGRSDKVPFAVRRAIVIDCLIRHCLIDVRNLNDEHGEPVPFERFCDVLRSGDFPDLVTAAVTASAMAGTRKVEDVADALGN